MRGVVGWVLVAGCSEYDVKESETGGLPATATGASTAASDPTTPEETAGSVPGDGDGTPGLDTGAPPATSDDGCFAPEFGYASSPAARLVTTDGVTPVTVTMVLSDTAYEDTLDLDAPAATALMDAWSTPPGTALGVGPFALGAELVFAIDVHDTGDHWQSGPASRNADAVTHVAVTYLGACAWEIGFEDLYGGGDLDFNDTVFRVEGMLVEE
jgi:hypothetical protein